MNVLSLFDGIACARVALDRVGIPVEKYYASEIDDDAMYIAQKNWKDIEEVGSVVGLLESRWIDKPIDLLIGGSPCQDLSIAKKGREGLAGKRSGLFYEFVRIKEELKPTWFILENVASMPKDAKDEISRLMGVEPIMINAALVSAQNRKRLFWTNIPNVTQPEDRKIFLKDILEEGEVDERMVVKGKAFSITASYNGAVEWNSVERKQRTMVRVGSFNSGGQGDRVYSQEGKSTALSANGGGRGAKTGLYAVAVASRGRNLVDGKRKDILGAKTEQRIEMGGNKANTLTSVCKDSMVSIREEKIYPTVANTPTNESIVRKLTPVEYERLQGLPDDYTKGISNNARYHALGNAFNADVISHILTFIPKD